MTDDYMIDAIGRRRLRKVGPRDAGGREPLMLMPDDPGDPSTISYRIPKNDPLLLRLQQIHGKITIG